MLNNRKAWLATVFGIIVFIGFVGIIGIVAISQTKSLVEETEDNYYHIGYEDCAENFNFTFDEMRIINECRIYKAENNLYECKLRK